jgi:hypothetical protein
MSLCKYRNIFGEPNKGVHSIRIFNIAIVDVIFTILGALLLYYFLDLKNKKINVYFFIFYIFVIGIIMHRIFCVDTTINKLIFGKIN